MKVLAIIFDGFEELEATAPFALLRRAKVDLTIASNKKEATGSHNLTYKNLKLLKKINYTSFDALILPGGPHYQKLENDELTLEIINHFISENKIIAAICASPTILGKQGYLKNKNYTCFTPLNSDFGGYYHDKGVVIDGNIITARSAAYSIDFAYAIIEKIAGKETLNTVWEQIFYEK